MTLIYVHPYHRTQNGRIVQVSGYEAERANNRPKSIKMTPALRRSAKRPTAETLPDHKRDWFKKRGDQITAFNQAVDALPGVTEEEKFVYGQIYVIEGGDDPHPKNGASAGITQKTLDQMKDSQSNMKDSFHEGAQAIPDLSDIAEPEDLSADQRAAIYRAYFDRQYAKIGGHDILNQIDDPLVAAATADAIFSAGPGAAATTIQRAINDTYSEFNLFDQRIDATGGFGSRTRDALIDIAKSETMANTYLDHLYERRKKYWENGGSNDDTTDKKNRTNEWPKWESHVEHFKFERQR